MHYIGIDESCINFKPGGRTRAATLALCYSNNPDDVILSDKELQKIKSFKKEFFEYSFLYSYELKDMIHDKYINLTAQLIEECRNRFCRKQAPIKVYFHGFHRIYTYDDARKLQQDSNFKGEIEILTGDDTGHPLVHRADNLARMLSWIHGDLNDKDVQRKVKNIKEQCPDLGERLKRCLVNGVL